jgi:hypothetical protein
LAKVELQNLFIATACNVKRWLQGLTELKSRSHSLFSALGSLLYRMLGAFLLALA